MTILSRLRNLFAPRPIPDDGWLQRMRAEAEASADHWKTKPLTPEDRALIAWTMRSNSQGHITLDEWMAAWRANREYSDTCEQMSREFQQEMRAEHPEHQRSVTAFTRKLHAVKR